MITKSTECCCIGCHYSKLGRCYMVQNNQVCAEERQAVLELYFNIHFNWFIGHRDLAHSIPSMLAGVFWGALFNIIDAFNRASTTATRCDKCLMTSLSSSPLFLASALPILFTCSTIVSDQAPRVSMGRGQKDNPASLHSSPCFVIFLS